MNQKSDHPTSNDEDDAQKTDDNKDKTQPSEDKDTPPVSKDAAQTTALNHAGLAAGSVTNITTDLKTEGDGKVYNISLITQLVVYVINTQLMPSQELSSPTQQSTSQEALQPQSIAF